MKTRYSSNLIAIILLSLPASVWAQQPFDDYHWPHMMRGGSMLFGPLMMILFFALIATIIVLVLKRPGGQNIENDASRESDAVNILRERFAKGEIDKQEYQERLRILKE